MNEFLSYKNVNFFYHTKDKEIQALKNTSFSVDKQEFSSLVGPSGCGKTTILSLSAGLLNQTEGEIFLDGKTLKKNDSRVGYMFQKDHLFEWRSIWKNITLGIEIKKPADREKKIEKAEMLLKKYDLYMFKNQHPHQLSGGMRQRVALIRTLVTEPDLLLLDEPFSALDFQTRLLLCDDVYNMIKSEKKTALLVTHDINEALSMSEKIIILSKRPASVVEIMKPALSGETPLQKREDSSFLEKFDKIWRLLGDEK